MPKNKNLSVLISLVFHTAGLGFVLSDTSDFDQESERNESQISVSLIPVSEFDAQFSKAPELVFQMPKLQKRQHLSHPSPEPLEFYDLKDSDSWPLKFSNLEVLARPPYIPELLRRREPSLAPDTIKELRNLRDTSFKSALGVQKNVVAVVTSGSEAIVPRIESNVVFKSIPNEKVENRRDNMLVIPNRLTNGLEQVTNTTLVNRLKYSNNQKVTHEDIKFDSMENEELKNAKLSSIEGSYFFSKTAIPKPVENSVPPPNLIESIKQPKSENGAISNAVLETTISDRARATLPRYQGKLSIGLSVPRVDEKLASLRDNAFKISKAKPNNDRANFRDGVEEHISSSWGSAIEQKILSNLVYPKKARNMLLTGKVFLKLEIFADGTISRVFIRRSSGHSILDKAAKAAVLRSLKLPAAPDYYPNKKFIFNLPVKFNV